MTNESADGADRGTPTPTPDKLQPLGLRRLSELHYALSIRELVARRVGTEPQLAEPLSVDEHLELLAVDTAIARLVTPGMCVLMHHALLAGAEWAAIAAALGQRDEHEPRERYAEWVEQQSALWDRQIADGAHPYGMPPHERDQARAFAKRPPKCEACNDAGCSACRPVPDHSARRTDQAEVMDESYLDNAYASDDPDSLGYQPPESVAALPQREPHTPDWWNTGSDDSAPVSPIGPQVFDRALMHSRGATP